MWPLFGAFVALHLTATESAWKSWCIFPLLMPLALVLLNYFASRGVFSLRRRAVRVVCSRAVLFIAIAICLLFCRYPLLLGGNSNPDESQFAASALRLFVDPVYYRAVDTGTSGPLNIFPLILPAIFGLSPDYASTRMVGLLIIYLSIYLLYRAFREIGPDDFARAAILPAVAFFAMVTFPDFTHYSSEHVSLLLLSLGVFACARIFRAPDRYAIPLVGLGALVSAAFFAKMQAVPITAAAGAVALAYVHVAGNESRVWRPALLLCAGLAPLPVLVVAISAATGSLPDFWTTYIASNWTYAQAGGGNFFEPLPRLAPLIVNTPEFQFLILTFLVLIAVSVYRAIRREPGSAAVTFLEISTIATALIAAATCYSYNSAGLLATSVAVAFLVATGLPADRRIGWFGVLAGALLSAALFSVYAPRRGFPHYLLLLVIPLCATMGWLLLRWASSEFFMLFLALIVGWTWYLAPSLGYSVYQAHESLAPPEGALIRQLTRPGSGIVVWGWHCETYLAAARPPATRDATVGGFTEMRGAAHDYYRDRFLRDLRRRPADLLVDALDVSCCYFNDRKKVGFQTDPLVRSYIYSHYIPVADAFGEHFYLRRELADAMKPATCAADSVRCYEASRGDDRTLAAITLPEHALLQMVITPIQKQEPWVTVFRGDAGSGNIEAFRLETAGDRRYRFSVRDGDQWLSLRDFELAFGKQASLSMEWNPRGVAILLDGQRHDEMALSHRMSGTTVRITLAPTDSGPGYVGAIDSFQIRPILQ